MHWNQQFPNHCPCFVLAVLFPQTTGQTGCQFQRGGAKATAAGTTGSRWTVVTFRAVFGTAFRAAFGTKNEGFIFVKSVLPGFGGFRKHSQGHSCFDFGSKFFFHTVTLFLFLLSFLLLSFFFLGRHLSWISHGETFTGTAVPVFFVFFVLFVGQVGIVHRAGGGDANIT